MTEPRITYRGVVYPWQCDAMGHFTTRFYMAVFDEAAWHFLWEAGFDPAEYTTPMVRIIDQETLLAGAAQLFRFAQENHGEVRARLDRLQSDYPYLVSQSNRAAASGLRVCAKQHVGVGRQNAFFKLL